jgi:exonuclease SbcD
VRIVTGTLADLLGKPDPACSRDDYLCAHLTDADPVLEPMARLREVYPNMMELQFARTSAGTSAALGGGDHRQRRPDDLFKAFYRAMLGEEIGDAALSVFKDTTETLAGGNDGIAA